MSRNRRNRYVGKWEESPPEAPIELPFTFENIREVVRSGLTPGDPFTHQQIADWARRYWKANMKASDSAATGMGEHPDERGLEVLEDIDAHWDLYLFNTYSFEELQADIDLADIALPTDWFARW